MFQQSHKALAPTLAGLGCGYGPDREVNEFVPILHAPPIMFRLKGGDPPADVDGLGPEMVQYDWTS